MLYFYYGLMYAGKTSGAIQFAKEKRYSWKRGMQYIYFMPEICRLDDSDVYYSRKIKNTNYSASIKVIYYDHTNNDLIEYLHILAKEDIQLNIGAIFLDEAQFLSKEQIDLLSLFSNKYDIDIYCFGLLTNYKRELFEGSKRLLEISDEFRRVENVANNGVCYLCGEHKAVYNSFIDNGNLITEGNEVIIQEREKDKENIRFITICNKCYYKFIRDFNPKSFDDTFETSVINLDKYLNIKKYLSEGVYKNE